MSASSISSRASSLWHGLRLRFGKGGTLLLAVMATMLVCAVVYAIEGEKPWGRTVQKRLQKNEALKPPEYTIIGLWWAAVVNAGVLAVLLGTAGKWMPRHRPAGQDAAPGMSDLARLRPDLLTKRWMLPVVLGAVVFGAWERWPKLTQSFWNDEAYAINRFVHGTWERQDDGAFAFEPVTWVDTLFECRNGNNHLLNSYLARVSLDAWRAVMGKPREAFNEPVTRLPNLIAGLGTIFMMFLLGREIGSPLAGVGAAWLLALHPWHIRYSVEMRGYSLMLLFVSFALFALVRALRTDRLRWWLLFGVCEALFLLSFPGALYVALLVNVMCLLELLRRRQWGMTGRLVAFNALAAVPVLQLMLPIIPQMLIFLKRKQAAYVTDVWQWLHDLASVIAVGWQYDNPYRETHVGTDWKGVIAHFHVPPMVLIILLAGLCLTGMVLALFRGTASRLVVIAPVLAGLVGIAINLRPGSPMTVWYLIYLLIPATLAVLVTLEAAGNWKRCRWLSAVFCAAFVCFYAAGTRTAVAALRDHDRQAMRQTIEYIRAQSKDALTATFSVSDRQNVTYDPRVDILESVANLESCITRSREASLPLYVYYCSDQEGAKRNPDIYQRVVKSGEFERLSDFPGSEELYSYRVFRLK